MDLDFANRILLLRRAMSMKQDEFAKLIPCSRNYLSMVEGGREPSETFKTRVERLEKAHKSSLNEDFDQSEALDLKPTESVLSVAEEPIAYGPRGKLKAGRLALGMTVPQFAKAIGYPDTGTYQAIEDGVSRMGEKMIRKAAKLLGISESELMNGADEPPSRDVPYGSFGAVPNIGMGPGMEKSRAKFVPLLSMAECGSLGAWDDNGYTGEGYLAFDVKDPKAFAVTLSGDSMAPVYTPGDVAIVSPGAKPRNGMVVIARLNDGHNADVMFKLFQASGNKVVLSSYNPAYPPMEFTPEAFSWIYPVSQVSKKMPGF
ncbi:S24 family peptidase [Prosthecobacter dejongeii]|uniref:SOS-response transcriptional repressor LexA n=1 Tax=Prosthecobacter dejongeii TaxID=48465 RepID=A0A7W7YJ93_9BACT|nr:S24 family peptidase [Prosthecobacter dejongeii]MBB5037119.1 SOS-response transcriptional repressor LexA [Prosthecobacter dejongeii]